MGEKGFEVGELDSNERCNFALLSYEENPLLQFGQEKSYNGNSSPPVNFNLWFFSQKNLSDIIFPSFRFLENIKKASVVNFKQALKRAGHFAGTIYENASLVPKAEILQEEDIYRPYPFDPAECRATVLDPKNYSVILNNHYANMLIYKWGHDQMKTKVRIDAFDSAISGALAHYLIDISTVKISKRKTPELRNGLDELLSYFNPVISE